ncbi:MAG: 4-hydroxythreonine-4-phosphate dehydrogenase PdxA, partial [Beijerinckiaceae bacterium]|nr:4-hydroxythreonine-4-phosphate dehydrogenase PdxA [Beijerinckiaceae bacterium]
MSDIIRRGIHRRGLIQSGAGLIGVAALLGSRTAAADDEIETHGLSAFGDLALPADFKRFAYVNPDAPKGGLLSVQIKSTAGNQNFDTFNTFNVFILKGDGAAGMDATFDTLMAGHGDEPDSVYGLVAKSVKVSADKLTYRFLLRPEARFHDGSRLTAADVAFSLNVLKEKGHPVYQSILAELASAEAESDGVVTVRFSSQRSRNAHLTVAGMPIFSATYYKSREFDATTLEAPLASGPYKLSKYDQGRFVEFERVKDYWGANLPVNVGQNNFDRIRYSYFADRSLSFERFKDRTFNFQQEYTARIWATGYDFPAFKAGKVKKEALPKGDPTPSQGWYFNTRREQFKDRRIREALGLAFDFEWTNANIMFGSYKRLSSYFENSPLKAEGKPSPEELALLEPFRGKINEEAFGEPFVPPVSDGSGSDRALLRQAAQLLKEAGCTKGPNGSLLLPGGKPFEIEFLDFQQSLLKGHGLFLQAKQAGGGSTRTAIASQLAPASLPPSPLLAVVPVTIHVSIRDALGELTSELIVSTVRIVATALKSRFGIA